MDQKIKSLTTQKLILETSFQMFYENGFNHTSIPDIMKKTNDEITLTVVGAEKNLSQIQKDIRWQFQDNVNVYDIESNKKKLINNSR